MTEPGDADAATEFGDFDPGAYGIDNTHDLMTRHERKLWIVEITVHDVKISSTDGTGLDLDPQLAWAGLWIITFDKYERFPDLLKNHRFHG
ncbi:hypothetical protein RsS62_00230 [Rhizobium dioscoreae]|nr:hypothetical protein RsS62_00230 [Rhizobium dioscoreae]